MAYKMPSPEGECHNACVHMSYLTSIAPVVMGNKLLYIARVCIHYKSLYNHLLPWATGTIQIQGLKLASPNGIDSIIHRLPNVRSEDLHTHTNKWKCESGRCHI